MSAHRRGSGVTKCWCGGRKDGLRGFIPCDVSHAPCLDSESRRAITLLPFKVWASSCLWVTCFRWWTGRKPLWDCEDLRRLVCSCSLFVLTGWQTVAGCCGCCSVCFHWWAAAGSSLRTSLTKTDTTTVSICTRIKLFYFICWRNHRKMLLLDTKWPKRSKTTPKRKWNNHKMSWNHFCHLRFFLE